jgi:hypothetical protein
MSDNPVDLALDLARIWVARFPPGKEMNEASIASAEDMQTPSLDILASLLRATGPMGLDPAGNSLDYDRAVAMATLAEVFNRAVREIAGSSDESEIAIAARICAEQAEADARRREPNDD